MTAIAGLAGVSLGTSDPGQLAELYRQLLGPDLYLEGDDFIAFKGAGILVTAQRVEGHVRADWPTRPAPTQLHLELAADDLDAVESVAITLGATRAVDNQTQISGVYSLTRPVTRSASRPRSPRIDRPID